MTLNNLMPWGRRELPIRREEEYRATPALLGEFDTSFRDLERLFDRFLGLPESSHAALSNAVFTPSLDVHETEKEFQIPLEILGIPLRYPSDGSVKVRLFIAFLPMIFFGN